MAFGSFMLSLAIALVYNIFAHYVTATMYKNSDWIDKKNNGMIMLFIAGIVGIVFGRIILPDNPKYDNDIVNNGLLYGGVLLIITAILANLDTINSDGQIILIGGLFGLLVWIAYKYFDQQNNQENPDEDLDYLIKMSDNK